MSGSTSPARPDSNENGQNESCPNGKSPNDPNEITPNDHHPSILDPPACVSGMKQLDRAKFEKRIRVTCVKAQSKDLKSILKFLKPYLLKKVNFHPVVKQGEFSI